MKDACAESRALLPSRTPSSMPNLASTLSSFTIRHATSRESFVICGGGKQLQSKIAAVADKGGQGASEIGGLNPAAELAAESKRCRAEILEAKAAKEEATLHADESNEELAAQIRAYASALGEMKGLDPGRYGDAAYWEERHAGDRRTGHTYEWYTDYPEEALRQVLR